MATSRPGQDGDLAERVAAARRQVEANVERLSTTRFDEVLSPERIASALITLTAEPDGSELLAVPTPP